MGAGLVDEVERREGGLSADLQDAFGLHPLQRVLGMGGQRCGERQPERQRQAKDRLQKQAFVHCLVSPLMWPLMLEDPSPRACRMWFKSIHKETRSAQHVNI